MLNLTVSAGTFDGLTYLLSQLIHCKNILVALTRVVTLVAWLILVSVANL